MKTDSVSIIFICLREYNLFFDRFYDSCEKLFLKDVKKKYYVITDHGPEFLGNKEHVTYCRVKTPKLEDDKGRSRVDKRRIKLNKFSYIDEYWNQIRQSDYIFYFDADSVIRKTIRQEDIIDSNKSIVGVVHGFGNVRQGKGRKGVRFEGDPKSAAYVDPEKYDTSTYYQSCLWGGKPNDVRSMIDDIKLWIEKDLEIKHVNKYNICDEVYVNKYFVLNKDKLHELDGRYSSPSEGIAYRKGLLYDGKKDIIISHECAAQNNTYRKFMKKDDGKAIAFHFNGRAQDNYSKEQFEKLSEIRTNNSKKAFDFSECDIFTFDNLGTTGMLFDSCQELGVPIVNLGEPSLFEELKSKYVPGEKWKWVSEGTTSRLKLKNDFLLMHKLFAIYDYLQSNQTKQYFFFFDQSDVTLTNSPSEKLEVFKDKQCGMLFNAESRCMYWPMIMRRHKQYRDVNKYFVSYGDIKEFEASTYKDCYVSNEAPLRFLNSGGFVARRDYYVEWFNKYKSFLTEFIHLNDQTVMHHFHFLYYPEIQIDHKCEIFQCMGPAKTEFNI